MIALSFASEATVRNGKRVSRATFERRSTFPMSAACLVANSIRERLASVFATEVSVRLLEPQVPDERAWSAIVRDARVFSVSGSPCEAAFVLRPRDALAVASSVFGERVSETRNLSALESSVLDRTIASLVQTLAPICGVRAARAGAPPDVAGYATYFEVLLEKPIEARIGIAIARDPEAPCNDCVRPADLLDARLALRAELGSCVLESAAFLQLRPGVRLRLQAPSHSGAAILRLNGRVVASGDAGTCRGSAALLVRSDRGEQTG